MQKVPENLRFPLFRVGPRWDAWSAMVVEWLGLGCLIVGIVGDAINRVLGLEPTSWFLLAIALWLWGLWAWICGYAAAKEG